MKKKAMEYAFSVRGLKKEGIKRVYLTRFYVSA